MQIPHLQYIVTAKLDAGKAGVHFFGLGGFCYRAHTLNAPFHGNGAAVGLVHPLKGPQAQLLRRFFQLLDLGLLFQVLLHLLLIAALLFDGIEAVIAAVKRGLAVQHLDNAVDGAVEEIAVMGNGNHRTAEGADILLQPLRGLQVQMVGRLIQQQDVRVLQNEPAQVDAGLFAAGKPVEQPRAHLRVNAQAVGHLIHRRIGVVAAP